MQILRNIGLAARFVSGYLIQLKPDVKPLEGPEGATADFTDLHAWAEVYVPGRRLDRARSHFRAVRGRRPHPAGRRRRSRRVGRAHQRARHEPAEVAFSFDMRVTRIHETRA